ncbi:hypothetical protein [Paenarthrobacter sp. C1]|uniref:hypothetical protein n=1 Tax=Paenarthrobacter sp. C1 TaxID=3400220 RepID=UPI003BF5E078
MVYADIYDTEPVEATCWLWAPGDHWHAMPETDMDEWAASKRITATRWMKRPVGGVPETGWIHYRGEDKTPEARRFSYTPAKQHSIDLRKVLNFDDEATAAVLEEFVLVPRAFLPIAEFSGDDGAVQAGSAIYPVTMDTDLLRAMAGAQLAVADFIDGLGEEKP